MYIDPSGYAAALLRDLANAAGLKIDWNAKTKKAEVTVNGKIVTFDNTNNVNGRIVVDDSLFRSKINSQSSKTGVKITSTNVTSKYVDVTKTYKANNRPVIVQGIVQNNLKSSNDISGKQSKKSSKSEVLVLLAAGINTDASDHMFDAMKTELKNRYFAEGKTALRFVEVFPIGENKDNNIAFQIDDVRDNMNYGTGGKDIVDAVIKNRGKAGKIILIGHSGGGQAVGNAIVDLGKKGINVDRAVQIGAPAEPIQKEYAGKVLRVQTKTDIVSNEAYEMGTNFYKRKLNEYYNVMPETRYVDTLIDPDDLTGGHSSYFTTEGLKVTNIKKTVNAFWNKIK